MIDRKHRVCLTATEGGLELHNRLAGLARQPLGHLLEEHSHALGDVGAVEELHRVAVLG